MGTRSELLFREKPCRRKARSVFALQSSEFCLLGYPRKGHKVLRVKVRSLHPVGIRHWTMGWILGGRCLSLGGEMG